MFREFSGKVLVFSLTLFPFIAFTTTNPADGSDFPCGETVGDALSGPGSDDVVVPWAASVIAAHNSTRDMVVAGVVVTPSLILTSALFFIDPQNKRMTFSRSEEFFVTAGTREFGAKTRAGDKDAQTVNVTHIRLQPDLKIDTWTQARHTVALLHLSHPLNISSTTQPICLPQNASILQRITKPGDDVLVLNGWTRGVSKQQMFQRLSVLKQETCRKMWTDKPLTHSVPFVDRYCAIVGQENNHSNCINRDSSIAREIDGKYYLGGNVNQFYSTDYTTTCTPGALFFLWDYDQNTYSWISKNIICGPLNFTCSSGQCINLTRICDQVEDCRDGSDENKLMCQGSEDDNSFTLFDIIAVSVVGILILATLFIIACKLYSMGVDNSVSEYNEHLLPNGYDDDSTYTSSPRPRWKSRPHLKLIREGPIGSGFSSTVWSAVNESPQRNTQVAIKQMDLVAMLTHFNWSEGQIFIEQKNLSLIRSKNVIEFYDAWAEG